MLMSENKIQIIFTDMEKLFILYESIAYCGMSEKIIWGMRKRQTFEIKLEGTQDSLWLLGVGTLC